VVGVLEHRVMAGAPIATYRLQLTGAFGFRDAARIVPYLAALGISHVYASPILQARAGSTHGYDMVDPTRLNAELGGDDGFAELVAALRAAGLGLIVDFVPNHMGVLCADNPWWLDVLEWGPASPHARAFDIEWRGLPFRARPGVLVPVLGRPYGEALAAGEIALRYEEGEGTFSAWYFEHRLPIAPYDYRGILGAAVRQAGASDTDAGRALLALADTQGALGRPTRDGAPAFKTALAAIAGGAEIISSGLAAYAPQSAGGLHALHLLLERQNFRLAHWRLASTRINYRRFFDINSLAGLRVEDEATFTAVHARIAPLIAEGAIDGLRLDHIDGLADPAGYCARLRDMIAGLPNPSPRGGEGGEPPGLAFGKPKGELREPGEGRSESQSNLIGPLTPALSPAGSGGADALPEASDLFPIYIEKILGEGEPLPPLPGVTGTTGYEWLNVIAGVLLDQGGLPALDRLWHDMSGDGNSFADLLAVAKREVLEKLLAAEFETLCRLLERIAAGHPVTRDFAPDRLRAALAACIIHFPVYRTYVTAAGASDADRAVVERAITAARAIAPATDAPVFDLLRNLLTLDLVAPGHTGFSRVRARRFVRKLQQLTGPAMAKSLEDTAFYRFHRLIALNEVGGNPAASGLAVDEFHRAMQARVAASPAGLTATATHDTKRGEDARARILALAEIPDEWAAAVAQWRAANARHVQQTEGRRAPSAAHEYMLYQALIGAWPLDDGLGVERFEAYARKAAREGKEETSWLDPDEAYENGLAGFIAAVLGDPLFVRGFDAVAQRAALIGALNSLSQLALKIAMPGVPDFYQGTELWDLSLVDPDNRRPVDFAARADALTELSARADMRALAATWSDGRIKLALTQRLLAFRGSLAEVFARGDYRPLAVTGEHRDHVIAFARCYGEDAAIVVVGRHFAALTDRGRHWPRPQSWQGEVELRAFSPAVGGAPERAADRVPLASLFDPIPVAMLHARKGAVDATSTG
jgi:(1->4)-alpha-D-glucan 1-alpha-D-glucosylmutase